MVTSHIRGGEKYSSQSNQEAHDTETANSSKSAALVRTLQVYRAEATVHTEGHSGKSYLERLEEAREFPRKQMNVLPNKTERKGA